MIRTPEEITLDAVMQIMLYMHVQRISNVTFTLKLLDFASELNTKILSKCEPMK